MIKCVIRVANLPTTEKNDMYTIPHNRGGEPSDKRGGKKTRAVPVHKNRIISAEEQQP